MRVFFCSKQRALLGLVYGAALALLAAGGIAVLPGTEARPALAQPYRCGDADSSLVSLSFNVDWGEEYLPDILSLLEEEGVRATFFLTGRWCDEHPDLAAAIAEAGHELGNHGYSHASPNASAPAEIIGEISRTEQSIRRAAGVTTRLYAPPSGEEEEHVLAAAAEAGYQTVLWSVDTVDWQQPDAATVRQRVAAGLQGGAIILAHPTACTLAALPGIIADVRAAGCRLVPVSENLGLSAAPRGGRKSAG